MPIRSTRSVKNWTESAADNIPHIPLVIHTGARYYPEARNAHDNH
jgi:hypothetical protein